MKLEGVYTALITPFESDGSIDEKALRDIVESQIEKGISGVVPMGTTGESPTLDHKEHIKVIKIVTDQAKKRIPVIAGTGSNCTRGAIEMTQAARECGISASLQVAPYYNKPMQEGLYKHFSSIADAVELPIIIYNIPGRTGRNIENSTMLRLSQHPHIIGVKEASGDIGQIMDLIAQKPESFIVLSGDDNLVFSIVTLGGRGVISVASNLIPTSMKEFVSYLLKGEWDKGRKMHFRLLPFFKGIFIETNPIPIKAALAEKGMIKESYRLPMTPMSAGNKRLFLNLLKDYDIQ